MNITFRQVTFRYPDQQEDLFTSLNLSVGPGWTGVVGTNGVGKTTLAALAAGIVNPTQGSVAAPPAVYVIAQESVEVPDAFLDLLADSSSESLRLIDELAVDYDWPYRWESLSAGERKRAEIAGFLGRNPPVIILDEPTNHLDIDGRERLREALSRYRGIGLIISHDRVLLDELCTECVFIRSATDVRKRPGGVTAGMAEEERERVELGRRRAELVRRHDVLRGEFVRRRSVASAQNRRRSKRGLARGDSDAREKIDRARVTGQDGDAGRALKRLDGRVRQLATKLAEVDDVSRGRRKLGVSAAGTAVRSDRVISLAAATISLGPDRMVTIPDLDISPTDRIAIVGKNGCGKSTLLRRLLASVAVPKDRYLYIPQEFAESTRREIEAEVRVLSNDDRGEVLSFFSRLGSDPQRVLDVHRFSPGECRKLQFALRLAREDTALLLLDEPFNHLDMDGVDRLVEAIDGFPGALVFVSHDRSAIAHLADRIWRIEPTTEGDSVLRLGWAG